MSWNGSGSNAPAAQPAQKPTAAKKSPAVVKGIVAGFLVIGLACAIGAFFLTGKGPAKKQVDVARKGSRIVEHKRATPTVAPAKETKPVQQKTLKERCKERFGDEKLTPARLAVLSCAKETIDLRPIVESNKVGEVRLKRYSNPLHQELVKYVHPGMPCDVPDGITDKEARKLCDGKMEYDFDDPDDVLEEKKAVEELVGQLRKHLDDGGHAQDFFKQLMERQDAEYEMMKTAKKNITELCRNGDKKLAQEALDKYNAYLKSKGLPSVKKTPLMNYYLKKGEKSE